MPRKISRENLNAKKKKKKKKMKSQFVSKLKKQFYDTQKNVIVKDTMIFTIKLRSEER
jgi:hypothetical protein